MNIKGLVNNVIPFAVKKKEEPKTQSAFDADNDKEGNGQSSDSGDKRRRNLSPEEIEDAIAHLKNLSGIKENGLSVRAETTDGVTVVYVEDRDGKVIRRIPEADLSLLTGNKERKSGNLLNRAL
jgi:uncharacterized FlaG/YvyC family protein